MTAMSIDASVFRRDANTRAESSPVGSIGLSHLIEHLELLVGSVHGKGHIDKRDARYR